MSRWVFGSEGSSDEGVAQNVADHREDFDRIFNASFYNFRLKSAANSELCYEAFLDFKNLCYGVTRFHKDHEPKIKSFFAQWNSPYDSHEKVAFALSLKDFSIRVIEFFSDEEKLEDTQDSASEGSDREFWSNASASEPQEEEKLKNIWRYFLPSLVIQPVRAENYYSLQICVGDCRAYFKVGALRACTDQALYQLGKIIGKSEFFAKSLTLRLFSDEFTQMPGLIEFKTRERFSLDNKITVKNVEIPPDRLFEEAKNPRICQSFLLGSLQPEYELAGQNKFNIASDEELLILLSVEMLLHLRDIKAEDMAGTTHFDAEIPLIPENSDIGMAKMDLRILENCFARKMEGKNWETLLSFLEKLNGEGLHEFISNFSSANLDYPIQNFTPDEAVLFEPMSIEAEDQIEDKEYQKMLFSPDCLFSSEQAHVLRDNIILMKRIVATFVQKPQSSILQWIAAFDPIWAHRFTIFKLFRFATGDLRTKLFCVESDNENATMAFRTLKNSCDASAANTGLPMIGLELPKLKYEILTRQELEKCAELLGGSLNHEDILAILGFPKAGLDLFTQKPESPEMPKNNSANLKASPPPNNM